MPRDSLRELQRAFQRLATGEGGLAEALLAGDARRRMAIYAEAYFWRLHDVIAEQHEALRAALGDPAFEGVVRRYLAAHPPAGHDIGRAGARLAEFLAAEGRAELAETARFTQLQLDLFVAADAAPLALATLAALAPEQLPGLVLRPVPAFALFEARRTLLWRRGHQVSYRVVAEDDEWRALERLARGCSLAELGELLAADAPVGDAAQRLGALVARWIEDEMLVTDEASVRTMDS